MSAIVVHGYVPNQEYGKEISYVTYIYHTEIVGDKIKFVVWNPINQFWEIIPSENVRPVMSPTQDIPTSQAIKEYRDWLKEQSNG